jgi:hypothetical protein
MTDVTQALWDITEANQTIESNESLFDRIPQAVIAVVVVGVWAAAVILMFSVILNAGLGNDQYVCNTPPAGTATIGSDCTNGAVFTREQLKDVFTFAVLPLVTLVFGFYFGQKSKSTI